jgi:CPA2 family monovalent cation:H+ antiporter-2
MHEIAGLGPFVIILAVSSLVVGLFHLFKLPTITGFLATGVVIGPAAAALIEDRHTVEQMAELGVILLMFTIGLEFSVREMWHMRRQVFGGGLVQMVLTGAGFAGLILLTGRSLTTAVVWGAILSLSSTAIVLKLLGDAGRLGSPHGRAVLGILLFQDVAVVLIMLMLPVLAGSGTSVAAAVLKAGTSMAFVLVLLAGASFAFPHVLKWVVSTRSQELFRVATMLTILGTAYLAGEVGLSLALGAFIAGMVVADSPYSHQMHAEIMPLRDVFNGVFFVSVGMLFDLENLLSHLTVSLTLFVIVLAGKAALGAGAARVAGVRGREAWMAGIAVSQVGEFAFVLASKANYLELLDPSDHRIFVNVAVLSMVCTPAILSLGNRWLQKAPAAPDSILSANDAHSVGAEGHVIVVGYGPSGQNVVRALRQLGAPFVVVEQNAQTVATLRAAGDNGIYGDATQPAVLQVVGMDRARAIVVTIASASAARGIVASARGLNPSAQIIARTQFVEEVAALIQLGADHVVPEEFETSLELTAHVLESYGVATGAVEREKAMLRAEFRAEILGQEPTHRVPRLSELLLHIETETRDVVDSDGGVGMTIKELDLRRLTGVNVLALLREGQVHSSGIAEFRLQVGDSLVMFGHGDQIQAAGALILDPGLRHTRRMVAIPSQTG